jgi:hypothetical protein
MHRWNFSARFALVLFLFALPILTSISTAWAETTITLFFTNSGGEVQSLQIIDNICNKNMFSGHFAGPYAKKIDGFCVRDASNSVTEISISADGNDRSPSGPVPENSGVDVSTGAVTPGIQLPKQKR